MKSKRKKLEISFISFFRLSKSNLFILTQQSLFWYWTYLFQEYVSCVGCFDFMIPIHINKYLDLFQKNIHQPCLLCILKCTVYLTDILTSVLLIVFIFYFSHYLVTQIRIHLRTQWLHNYTRRTGGSMKNGWKRV